MSDIVAFLNARLDEDEAAAEVDLDKAALAVYNNATAHPRRKTCEDFTTLPSPVQERYRALAVESLPTLARVLREVKAKRAIVWQWEQAAQRNRDDECDEAAGSAWATLSNALVSLAGVYDSHPDYAGDRVENWTWPDEDPAWSVNTT